MIIPILVAAGITGAAVYGYYTGSQQGVNWTIVIIAIIAVAVLAYFLMR